MIRRVRACVCVFHWLTSRHLAHGLPCQGLPGHDDSSSGDAASVQRPAARSDAAQAEGLHPPTGIPTVLIHKKNKKQKKNV